MGRHARRLQRVRGIENKRTPGAGGKKQNQEDQTSVDIHEDNFCQDEIDEFHEAKEKLLLEGQESSSEDDGLSGDEEEVMGWSEEEESEEEEGDEFQLPLSLQRQLYASDDEEEMNDQQQKPEMSDRAWGHRKKTFYAVEGEDELSGSEGSEMAAELEEKEAIALQQRMAAALKDADFQPPSLPMVEESEEGEVKEERVLQDLSKLSKEDKLALLQKDSPELFDLLEDFEDRLSEVVDTLHPLVTVARDTPTITPKGKEYLETKLDLNLIYCMNIMFYLYLKASRIPVQSHPVIQRIVEIKRLIGRLEPLDDQLEGQLEEALQGSPDEAGEMSSSSSEREESTAGTQSAVELKKSIKEPQRRKRPALTEDKKKASKKQSNDETTRDDEDPLAYYERVAEEKKVKRLKKDRGKETREGEGSEDDQLETEEGKRAVTYQISRNRGLIPQRKKELRNPRVKHRNKYRKALVKHKSQVRAVVKELNRYGGETSGIRANVSHSIKLK